MKNPYFDANVLVYAAAATDRRGDRARQLLLEGGLVSVQGLNEFMNVGRRKLRWSWGDVSEKLAFFRRLLEVRPLTVAAHELGAEIAERYDFAVFDAMHVAAALEAGCDVLYSEDMQHGQKIGGLVITNPFREE